MKSDKDVVVSLQRVAKRYGDVTAVESLSLDVRRGELLCLLGPSGCGKTTTLRMVAGFVEPSDGTVLIDGRDMTREPPYRRDTGMVFQNYALFPHMTTAQNIAFGLENLKWTKADRDKRVQEMLSLAELAHLSDRLPAQLSGGQQQRVALARALAMRPAVLLLDEPFSNLDAQLRVRMREELREVIRKVEITTIFVTHDQEEALMLSDRIGVMNKGKLEQVGTPADIYERPASRFVAQFIGWCSLLDGVVDGSGNFVSERGFIFKSVHPAGAVTAVIRPEHVRASSAAASDGHPQYAAKVVTSNYYGGISRLSLDVSGERMMMDGHFPEDRRPRAGDEISITLETAQIRMMNREASAEVSAISRV